MEQVKKENVKVNEVNNVRPIFGGVIGNGVCNTWQLSNDGTYTKQVKEISTVDDVLNKLFK